VQQGPLTVRSILRVVIVVVAAALALWLVYRLRQPLTWIFLAGFIAIALSGPVWALSQRMPKGLAIAVVYLLLVLLPVGVLAVLVPPIIQQGDALITALPGYAADVQEFVRENDTLRGLEEDYDVTDRLREQAATLPSRLDDAAGLLSGIGLGLVNSIFAAVTILILSVFLLSSGGQWLEALARRRPPAEAALLRRCFGRIGRSTGNYFAGAITQALVAGISGYLVLLALGVPYAASLALLYGLLDFVPLVGASIGAVLVGLVTLFSDFPTDTIAWIVYAIVYQQLENNVIQPRIQSRAVAVHPFVVLVAVLFGGTLMGVLGALIAVPVAAAIQIAIRETIRFREAADELPAAVSVRTSEPPPPPEPSGQPAPHAPHAPPAA
jgi:predicted PurR-regulated permease PerM